MRDIKFDAEQNPARNFGSIVKDLEEISKKSGIPMTTILDMVLSDILNRGKEGYELKVNYKINGLSPNIKPRLISYLKQMKGHYKDKEAKERRKVKREEKMKSGKERQQEIEDKCSVIESEIEGISLDELTKLISDIKDGKSTYDLDSKEKKILLKKLRDKLEVLNNNEEERQNRQKAKIAFEQIEEIYSNNFGNDVNDTTDKIIKYFSEVKKAIEGKSKGIFNIKIGAKSEKILIELLDKKIIDETYFGQVEKFTDGFKFLRENSEIYTASKGRRKVKFTDLKSFDRFIDLRSKLQRIDGSEEQAIRRLLRNKKIDDIDKRILQARKNVIEKEREEKESEGR